MDYSLYVVVFLMLILFGLGYWNRRLSRENKRLEKLLSYSKEKLERLQLNFGKFTPEEVIENLTESGQPYIPNRRSVTVLFADLQNFTKMSQSLKPEQVVSILNGYFRYMSEAITMHHGQVTELLGDGILALFGALRNNPWQVQDAVKGGLAMREALKRYNEELKSKSLPPLTFGIGIHYGEVLAGVIGNRELSKFGVVGDTINLAARVESLTRIHGCDLLITEAVRQTLDDRFKVKEMPPVPVKGVEDPLTTYFVERMNP